MLLAHAEGHWAELVAHAPVGDHEAGQLGRLFQIHFHSGKGLTIDQPLDGAATHEKDEPGPEVVQPVVVPVLVRCYEVDTTCLAPRHDGYLHRLLAIRHH